MGERESYRTDVSDEDWALLEPVLELWRRQWEFIKIVTTPLRDIVNAILPLIYSRHRATTPLPTAHQRRGAFALGPGSRVSLPIVNQSAVANSSTWRGRASITDALIEEAGPARYSGVCPMWLGRSGYSDFPGDPRDWARPGVPPWDEG